MTKWSGYKLRFFFASLKTFHPFLFLPKFSNISSADFVGQISFLLIVTIIVSSHFYYSSLGFIFGHFCSFVKFFFLLLYYKELSVNAL